MLQFELEGNKVILKPEYLLSSKIKHLWDLDKSNDKEIAYKWLAFVFFYKDLTPANYLRSQEDSIRFEQSLIEAGLPLHMSQEEANALEQVCDLYELANKTAEYRFIQTIDKQLDLIRQVIEDNPPKIVENCNPRTGEIRFNSNMDIITKSIDKLNEILKKKEDFQNRLTKNTLAGNVHGKKTPSLLERGAIGKE